MAQGFARLAEGIDLRSTIGMTDPPTISRARIGVFL